MFDTNDFTYGGYSNRETYITSKWIRKDMSLYLMVALAINSSNGSNYDRAIWLREEFKKQLYEEIESVCFEWELLTIPFRRINWFEIVEKYE